MFPLGKDSYWELMVNRGFYVKLIHIKKYDIIAVNNIGQ